MGGASAYIRGATTAFIPLNAKMSKRNIEELYENENESALEHGSPSSRQCIYDQQSDNEDEDNTAAQTLQEQVDDMDVWQNAQDAWAEEVLQTHSALQSGEAFQSTETAPSPINGDATDGLNDVQRISSTGVHTKTLDVLTVYADVGGVEGVQRKFRFYRTEKLKENIKSIIGYVFDANLIDLVKQLLESVRKGKHRSVIWYALCKHAASPCSGLFEHPTDHYHLMVWFDDKPKAQDLAFHKRFYQWVHGSEWKSQKVRSERGLLQYMQCEPRELVELYSSTDHAKFVQHCYETRHEMQAKIDDRDNKKAKSVAKINLRRRK